LGGGTPTKNTYKSTGNSNQTDRYTDRYTDRHIKTFWNWSVIDQ
jgi:hypothetical protein